jgi:hypothetical protein
LLVNVADCGLLLRCRFTPRLIGGATIGALFFETDESRFRLIGPEAIVVLFETK